MPKNVFNLRTDKMNIITNFFPEFLPVINFQNFFPQ